MANTLIVKKDKKLTTKKLSVDVKKGLNLKQEEFCRLYVSFDKEYYGNASACYRKVYGDTENAGKSAGKLLDNPKITARINELLDLEGFNDMNVDKQLLFVINQHKKLDVKVKAIQEYNKFQNRVSNKLEIVMPKPIMDMDTEEGTREFEEQKVIDITGEEVAQ